MGKGDRKSEGEKTVIKKGEDCRVQEKNKREDIKQEKL